MSSALSAARMGLDPNTKATPTTQSISCRIVFTLLFWGAFLEQAPITDAILKDVGPAAMVFT
jgi:hypothetical protein